MRDWWPLISTESNFLSKFGSVFTIRHILTYDGDVKKIVLSEFILNLFQTFRRRKVFTRCPDARY